MREGRERERELLLPPCTCTAATSEPMECHREVPVAPDSTKESTKGVEAQFDQVKRRASEIMTEETVKTGTVSGRK